MHVMKFFETPNFKAINLIWKRKLKDSGFKDQEDSRGVIKKKEARVLACKSPEATMAFFSRLDTFLNETILPDKHRQILEMYTNGIYQTEISQAINYNRHSVCKIIAKYRKIIEHQLIHS